MTIDEVLLGKILAFSEAGYTQAKISEKTGVSQSAVSRCLKRYQEHGPITHRGGNGRPSVVSESIKSAILRQNKANSRFSLRKHAAKLANDHGVTICHNTVRSVLSNNDIFAYSPAKKPALSARHIENRLSLAQDWIGLTENEVKSIVFSDESKFNLLYSDGKTSVWREPGSRLERRHITETKKFGGGSVMVWACFSYYGPGEIYFIDGIMDAPKYVSILSRVHGALRVHFPAGQ